MILPIEEREPLKAITDLLVVLTLVVEVIRGLMIRQINRLRVVPRISQVPGILGMTNKICALHRQFFPDSRRASLLRVLRYAQLGTLGAAVLVLLVVEPIASRHQ